MKRILLYKTWQTDLFKLNCFNTKFPFQSTLKGFLQCSEKAYVWLYLLPLVDGVWDGDDVSRPAHVQVGGGELHLAGTLHRSLIPAHTTRQVMVNIHKEI